MRSLAIALLALALPAAVQGASTREGPPSRSDAPGIAEVETVVIPDGVGRELHEVREAIERRRDSGELSRREARALRREARRIARAQEWYARDGLDESELDALRLSAETLRHAAQTPISTPAS